MQNAIHAIMTRINILIITTEQKSQRETQKVGKKEAESGVDSNCVHERVRK